MVGSRKNCLLRGEDCFQKYKPVNSNVDEQVGLLHLPSGNTAHALNHYSSSSRTARPDQLRRLMCSKMMFCTYIHINKIYDKDSYRELTVTWFGLDSPACADNASFAAAGAVFSRSNSVMTPGIPLNFCTTP